MSSTQIQPKSAPSLHDLVAVKPGEHCTLVGPNGCGKSTVLRALLAVQPNVFVIDEKGDFDLPDARIIDDPSKLSKVRASDVRPVLYRPKPEFWDDDIYDAVYRWVYERKHTTLVTEEVYSVMKQSGRPPRMYQACLTRGRALGITCFQTTQRPFSVPISILSEAKHYLIWPLRMPDDIKRMQQLTSPNVGVRKLPEHAFWYFTIARANSARHDEAQVMLLQPARKGPTNGI